MGILTLPYMTKSCVYRLSPLQAISDKLAGFFGLNPEPHEGR